MDSSNSEIYKYILSNSNYSYRQIDCFDYCIGSEMFKRFNFSNKIDHYSEVFVYAYFLNLSFSDILDTYSNLIQGGLKSICLPICPLQCNEVKYDKSLSFTTAPKNSSKLKDLKSLNLSIDNIVYLNVYYSDLQYTHISQLIKTDIWDLISNIGGNLGLFIGFSFLTFSELFELIFEVIIILFNKQSTKSNETSSSL